jgi:hypothetical protein
MHLKHMLGGDRGKYLERQEPPTATRASSKAGMHRGPRRSRIGDAFSFQTKYTPLQVEASAITSAKLSQLARMSVRISGVLGRQALAGMVLVYRGV